MPTNVWRGTTPALAQVDTFTPASVEIGDIFTLTATADDSATFALSFTATAATVANVTAGLTAAWNASNHPFCTGVTAADATTALTLTADVAGRPFAVASSTTNGGAVNDQTLTRVATTSSSGPNDYGVANNWSLSSVPVAGEDVRIPPGTSAILYSLNQATIGLGTFQELVGHATDIGRWENGICYHLRINPGFGGLELRGSGSLCAIDIAGLASSPVIAHTGTPSAAGRTCVNFKGTAISTMRVESGNVGIANNAGEVSTITAGLNVGGTAVVTVGLAVTLTGSTIRIYDSATVYTWSAVITVTLADNAVWWHMAGACTTINEGGSARIYYASSGTCTNLNIWDDAEIFADASIVSKTFTNTNIYRKGEPRHWIPALTTWTTVTYGLAQAVP